MRSPTTRLLRVLALLFAVALVAAACGSDDDSGDDSGDGSSEEGSTDEGSSDEAAGNAADDSLDPVKIGLIAQDEELVAFPEVRAAAEAYVAFFNAEQGGLDGHPIELVVCGAGDTPESHVSCAQEFANDDDIHIVVNSGFVGNSAASVPVLVDAGKATMGLGNDFVDYLTPGLYSFDPGLPGLAQVFFVYASENRGVTSTMTLFIADDPPSSPSSPPWRPSPRPTASRSTRSSPSASSLISPAPSRPATPRTRAGCSCWPTRPSARRPPPGSTRSASRATSTPTTCASAQDVIESGVPSTAGPDRWCPAAPTIDGGDEVDRDQSGAGRPTARPTPPRRPASPGWALANMVRRA